MLRIALTGGIGSGKSAVSDRLIALGVPVFDADDFSHQVTRPGEPAIAAIADAFGAQVLTADVSRAAFDAICKTQATAEQCRQAADDLLINDDSLEALHAQVDTLHRRYLELAGVKGC